MKHLKLFEDFEPVPGSVLPQYQLHVFDFDDTLAVSKNPCAIALFHDAAPIHKNAQEVASWLHGLGLEKNDLIASPDGKAIEQMPNTKVWAANIKSSALPKVKQHYKDKFITSSGELPTPNGESLAIDYTPSANLGRAKPIQPVINKLKTLNDEGAKTVVMTARRGNGEGFSLDGKPVQFSNATSLNQFLKAHNAQPTEVLSAVGKDKGDKIKDDFFGTNNDPKEVHFYDDDMGNIDSVKNKVAGKVDADVFTYGPGKFANGEANPDKPKEAFPSKKKRH